jgi:hypothetical protein
MQGLLGALPGICLPRHATAVQRGAGSRDHHPECRKLTPNAAPAPAANVSLTGSGVRACLEAAFYTGAWDDTPAGAECLPPERRRSSW